MSYTINMYLAVDIGGTKTLVGVFTNAGSLSESVKFATPTNYDDFLQALRQSLAGLKCQEFDQAAVAAPGLIDRKQGIALTFGRLPWQNTPIKHDVRQLVHCPVIVENDTKLAALSEAKNIISEFKKVLYVTISTGISAGLIVNGVIDKELADSESGHMMLEYKGKIQPWEDFASGRAIVAKYGKKASEINDPEIWRSIAQTFAIGLINVIAIIQPEVIVIGGGVGSHFKKFQLPLLAWLEQYKTNMVPIPPLRPAIRPEEAVIYGCYHLAKLADNERQAKLAQ